MLTLVALAILTIPLAFQALGGDNPAYSWLLIAESITLVFVGMGVRLRQVTYWGLATAVIAILYQMRDLFFIALGIIGLSIIGIAIYFLLHRDQAPRS